MPQTDGSQSWNISAVTSFAVTVTTTGTDGL